MKRKKIDNDPVSVFIISLPRNKDWTVIQGLFNWDPLSSLCFMTFLFLRRKLRVTSSIWNYVSEAYLVACVALYCGPIVNQSFLDKIWLVSPAQCLSIVRGTFQHFCKKWIFSKTPNAGQDRWRPFWMTLQVLAVACPRINGSNVYAKL